MNEKQIEIALAKLRKLYKSTKTIKGREAIAFTAKTLKQGISGALIPLSYNQPNECCNDSVIKNYTDAELHDIKHHGLVAFGSY